MPVGCWWERFSTALLRFFLQVLARLSPKSEAISFHLQSPTLETTFSGGVDFQTHLAFGVVNLKKCYLLFGAALLTASVATATDRAAWEGFLGYNLVTFNPSGGNLSSFTASGGNGQLVFNFTRWVGVVLDVGAVHNGTPISALNNIPNPNVDHTMVNFVAGPRFTYQNHSRFWPFAQVMFGGAYSKASTSIALLEGGTIWPPPGLIVPDGVPQPLEAKLEAHRTGFAMIVGGGLDIKITKHIAFRPIGADYYLTRLPNFVTGNDTNRDHFRYSAGVNFLFGAR